MELFDNLKEKCGRIKNDEFYAPYLKELDDLYKKVNNETIAALTYQDFIQFYTTGSRVEYEKKYFGNRLRLTVFLINHLLYERAEDLEKICEEIWAICSEISWAVPAHLAREKVSDYRTYIDLFAAETAHSLAETAVLLKDKLPEKIYNLIINEITVRIFDSYEAREHFWEKLVSNWPGVCAGSIGATYLLLAPERFYKIKDRLLGNLDQLIKSYGDDGSNTEGISYWYYGFWIYLNFADILYRQSEGKIDIRHSEKIDKMANFISKLSLRKNHVISFSDGVRTHNFPHIGLYKYLIDNYSGVKLSLVKPEKLELEKNTHLSWALRNFFWSDPEMYDVQNDEVYGTEYLPDAEWYVVRRKKYSFAAKAGNNCEGHNHNDVGNFIFADDNGQMLADLGAMEYTAKSFSNLRYTILSNSSLGHSVPIVNGKAQKDGPEYKGTVLQVDDNTFSLELQDAYEDNTSKIVRTFNLYEDGALLTDNYEDVESNEYIERLISIVEPEVCENIVKIGNLKIIAGCEPEVTSQIIKGKAADDVKVWLIDYKVSDNIFKLDMKI